MAVFKNKLRPVQAKQHAEIDAWLRLMAGSQYPQLENWIANITNLEKADRVLVLNGPPGTGKTLLGRGLTRLWSEHPVGLHLVARAFNGDLIHCPLVLGDGAEEADRFLKDVGRTRRLIHRKYMDVAWLENAIRVILTHNSGSGADNALRIMTPATSAQYLDERRVRIEDWIYKDQIAEHALFLREKRTGT